MNKRIFNTSLLVGMLASLGLGSGALAQAYPTKPLRVVVPQPPGGGFDQPVAIASFITIALGAFDLLLAALFAATALRLRALSLPADRPVTLHAAWSTALSLLLIAAGNPLVPQITMVALALLASASLRLIRTGEGGNG